MLMETAKGIAAGKRATDKMRARGGKEEKVENERDREEEGKEQKEQGEEWRREEWGEGIEIGTEPRVQLKTAAPLTVREAVRRQEGRWTSLILEADKYDGCGDNKAQQHTPPHSDSPNRAHEAH
jgi:hypothetical protein